MTGAMANRRSLMPEANKMARMLRSGRTKSELAVRYGVRSTAIAMQLAANGWDPATGCWIGGATENDTRAPLAIRGGGPGLSGHHVGGGDNPNVVPTTTRPFVQRPKPTGLTWPVRENAPAAAPPKKPISGTWSHTRENNRQRKISIEQETELVKRYLDGESVLGLARAHNVNERTIRKRLRRLGVPLRGRAEALRLRSEQRVAAAAEIVLGSEDVVARHRRSVAPDSMPVTALDGKDVA